MGPEELDDMAKQQFILGVRNNVMRERLIVHRPKNLKEAIEYGRLLEVANRTARGKASPNVRGVFAAFSTSNATQMTNQASNRTYNAFNQQANYNLAVPLVECKRRLWRRIIPGMWHPTFRCSANR